VERRIARTPAHSLRAADADRDRVIDLLADAVADGRLTLDEHSGRVARAQAARTLGDLAAVTSDLAAPADQPVRLDGGRYATAIGRRDRRGGRWVVTDGFTAAAIFGDLDLDLTEAVLQRQRLLVRAATVLGSVRLLVPEGVRVEVTRTSPSGRHPPRVLVPGRPGGPVIEIQAFCALGQIHAAVPRRKGWLASLGFSRRGSGHR
jgi:Domain of unknown function (DUF1707)/Cell wall-active antibiotics response 4TMS YvqF